VLLNIIEHEICNMLKIVVVIALSVRRGNSEIARLGQNNADLEAIPVRGFSSVLWYIPW